MTESASESSTVILSKNVYKMRKAERSLDERSLSRRNDALLQFLVKSSDDAIICKSLEGKIVTWNAGAQRIYGYTAEEVIGKPISILVPPEIPDEIPEILEKIKRGDHVDHYQTVRIRKDRGRMNVSICVSPIKDGRDNIIGASVIARDITENMKHARDLEESEKKYRKLIEEANMGISILQRDRIVLCNSKMLEILGLKKCDLVGHSVSKLFPKEYLPEFVESSREIMQSKTASVTFQFGTTRADGAKLCLESQIFSSFYGGQECIVVFHSDVTERKKKEEELQQVERKFKTIVEGANDGIIEVESSTHRIVFANPAICRLTGYSEKELLGLKIEDIHLGEDLPFVTEQLEKTALGEMPLPEAVSVLRKDKSVVYCHINASLLKIGKQHIVVAFFRDFTESKKAQERLMMSEEKYRVLVENIQDIVFAIDLNGKVTFVSPSAERNLDFKPIDIVGKPFLDFFPLARGGRTQSVFARILKGEHIKGKHATILRKDGTPTYFEAEMYPVFSNGEAVGIQGIARDITESRRAHSAIQESQQKFKQLFMGNPEAAVYMDRDAIVLDINQRFSDLFGYSLADAKGKLLDDLIVPENRRKEATMLSRDSRKGYLHHESYRISRNDLLIPVAISAAPIVLHGKYLGSIVLYEDIKERRESEEKIRETIRKLEVTNEKLQVVGGLTRHDVRNKLAAIMGNVYLVKKTLPENSVIQDYVKQIEQAVEQSAGIFDFAKAYEMLGVEELVYIDVEKTVNDTISLLPNLKDIKVTNDCHDLTVLADSLLRQLFYNLIDNSIKHGGKLSMIRIHYEDKDDHLNMIYQDDGAGISPAEKSKLFSEGHSTGKGSGYGLYLIKKMMEIYGWTIKENGEPGKGALFTITVPKTDGKGRINYKLH